MIKNVPSITDSKNIKNKSLSIILPTFNEAGSIQEMVSSLLDLTHQYQVEILVVDDDSWDGTADIVRDLARQDSRVRLIQRVGRSGLASAIKEGLIDSIYPYAISFSIHKIVFHFSFAQACIFSI